MTGSVNLYPLSNVIALHGPYIPQGSTSHAWLLCTCADMIVRNRKVQYLLKVTPTLFISCKVDEGQWARAHKSKLIAPRSRKKSPVGFLNGLGHYLSRKKHQFIHSNRVLGKFPALVDGDYMAQSAGRQGEGWEGEGRGLGSQYVALNPSDCHPTGTSHQGVLEICHRHAARLRA